MTPAGSATSLPTCSIVMWLASRSHDRLRRLGREGLHKALNPFRVDDLVEQVVGTPRKANKVVTDGRVTGYDDRAVGSVEPDREAGAMGAWLAKVAVIRTGPSSSTGIGAWSRGGTPRA